jgi:hypothetical protein
VVCQDEAGRLWDVLFLLRQAIRRQRSGVVLHLAVQVRNDNRERTPPLDRLKTLGGPEDKAEPVVTVMVAAEDWVWVLPRPLRS